MAGDASCSTGGLFGCLTWSARPAGAQCQHFTSGADVSSPLALSVGVGSISLTSTGPLRTPYSARHCWPPRLPLVDSESNKFRPSFRFGPAGSIRPLMVLSSADRQPLEPFPAERVFPSDSLMFPQARQVRARDSFVGFGFFRPPSLLSCDSFPCCVALGPGVSRPRAQPPPEQGRSPQSGGA